MAVASGLQSIFWAAFLCIKREEKKASRRFLSSKNCCFNSEPPKKS